MDRFFGGDTVMPSEIARKLHVAIWRTDTVSSALLSRHRSVDKTEISGIQCIYSVARTGARPRSSGNNTNRSMSVHQLPSTPKGFTDGRRGEIPPNKRR